MLLIAVVDMIATEAITAGVMIADMTADMVPEVMTVMTVVTVVMIATVAAVAAVVMTVIAEAMTGGVMIAVRGPDPPGVEQH